jgi:radical SAM-linked protein
VAQVVCRYRKGEAVKWISHLDLKRTFERALRRAELPVELTQGHNPHLKLSFGPPLPLGATGDAELLAMHLQRPTPPDEVARRLNEQLPPGLEVVEAWLVPGHRKKETLGDVDVAEYVVAVRDGMEAKALRSRIEELLARDEIVVHRGGARPERTVNLRPFILSLRLEEAGEHEVRLHMRLRTGSHGGARPQEIVSALGLGSGELPARCHRVALYASAEAPAATSPSRRRRWARARGQEPRG